jgi:hypothetical protein
MEREHGRGGAGASSGGEAGWRWTAARHRGEHPSGGNWAVSRDDAGRWASLKIQRVKKELWPKSIIGIHIFDLRTQKDPYRKMHGWVIAIPFSYMV